MKRIYWLVGIKFFLVATLMSQNINELDTKKMNNEYKSDSTRNVEFGFEQIKAKPIFTKGYNLIDQNKFPKAIKLIKKAIEIDSTGNCGYGKNGLAQSELGFIYVKMRKYVEAKKYLRKAILLNKHNPDPYMSLCVTQLLLEEDSNAMKTVDELLKISPNYAIGYAQRGFILDSEDKHREAYEQYKIYIKLIDEQEQWKNNGAMYSDISKRIEEYENSNVD